MSLYFILDSLNFLLVSKILFIKKPITILQLKLFTKPVNPLVFKLQVRKLFKKKLFKNSLKKNNFFIKINIRQDLLKHFYHERKFFPEARMNFFKLIPYDKKNFIVKKTRITIL